MKNQYFGDINDYKKYGLLRVLSANGEISIAVCWMLTGNDGRNDGKHISYLQKQEEWRVFDPELFDTLQRCLHSGGERTVMHIERSGCLPDTKFYSRLLTDSEEERKEYFAGLRESAQGCDLIFFDPDNGIEVASKKYGAKDSCKYLYWGEIKEWYASGYSLLVYQHFPRIDHEAYTKQLVEAVTARLGNINIITFATSRVVYVLCAQETEAEYYRQRLNSIRERWSGVFLIKEWK